MIMKKYLYFISILILFFSCRRETDPVFDQSPDERLNEALQKYQSTLTGASNGWNATLITAIGITFNFYFRFNDSNRVFMYSDFDSTSAGVIKESSYRLKALQQPSLLFDTYSYIHMLADPDAAVNGGYYGIGLVSDFEFSIDSVTDDRITLTGRFHGSKAVLKKASQQDRDAWENKQVLQGRQSFRNINRILNYFKRLHYNGVQYELRIDSVFRQIQITWIDGQGNAQSFTTGYYFVPGGIAFISPLVNGSQTITGFTIGGWNESTATLEVQVNGVAGTIAGAIRPVNPDVNAGRRWWQLAVNLDTYWASGTGFHVNGIDDAFNVRSLKTDTSQYYYLVYWPGIQPSSGPSFDVMMPFYYVPSLNALDYYYGTAHRPNFHQDGRVVFGYIGDLTFGVHPTSGPAHNTRVQLYNNSGYWFVQTSEATYDMISAKDAKAWVSWQIAQ
jgi:hypothetical protein